jgi:hypothetical protein
VSLAGLSGVTLASRGRPRRASALAGVQLCGNRRRFQRRAFSDSDRERRSFEERERRLDARADPQRVRDRTDAEGTAENDADGERRQLEDCAHNADAEVRPSCADEHQRVARSRPEIGSDVKRGPDRGDDDAEHEQNDAHAEPVVLQTREPPNRRQRLDEQANENRVRDRSDPRLAAEQPRDDEDNDGDRDVRRAEREERVLREPLAKDIPRRQPELRAENKDDTERKDEQTEDEARAPRGIATANPRMRRARYSPKGLEGLEPVDCATAFASRYRSSVSIKNSRPKPDCL